MNWMDLLRMSINNLKRRKLRTFLTVLGVMIGTTSIVVMISLGLGLLLKLLMICIHTYMTKQIIFKIKILGTSV